MRDLVLEIGCEEIPARFMPGALASLERLGREALEGSRLGYESVRAIGTPRRLALTCKGLAERQEDEVIEVKGPPEKAAFDDDGRPTKAAEGFTRSQGVKTADLVVKELAQGRYLFARRFEKGRAARDVLVGILPPLIGRLEFPKSMRWGEGEFRFARPVRWILAIHGEEPLAFSLDGLASGDITYGHRFAHPGPVRVPSAGEYGRCLRDIGVVADQEERKSEISMQVADKAREAGGKARIDSDLLEEVTYLVEDPAAFWGDFDSSFLALPEEVLVTCMKHHQKYFPVETEEGSLMPRFIGVSNGGRESLPIIRLGNERVLKARLADARFFFEEDSRVALADRVADLEKVTFQESLGSMGEKARRVEALVKRLGQLANLPEDLVARAARAAMLCKADLTTHMVGEFPELQGTMGREYGLLSGEDPGVAQAIAEHYLPRFSGDRLPSSLEGVLLAIADKADTVTGCFLVGIQPTGSSDPYGLRRQALGIVVSLLESGLEVPLWDILQAAMEGYGKKAEVPGEVHEFFLQRVRGIMMERGLGHDLTEAVLARETGQLKVMLEVAGALKGFLKGAAGQDLLTAHRRSANLGGKAKGTDIDPSIFEEESENLLFRAIREAREKSRPLVEGRRWEEYLSVLASLRGAVDRFLDDVLVMAEDEGVRENRLALLRSISDLMGEKVDLGRLHLEGSFDTD